MIHVTMPKLHDERKCASCDLFYQAACPQRDASKWWPARSCYIPMVENKEAGLQALANERAATEDVTVERGERYGAPSDHFTRTVAILGIVFGTKRFCDLTRRDWPVIMECDKLARFANSLDDPDSQVDIGGYSKTWFMAEEPPSPATVAVMRSVLDCVGGAE